jgi:hypothetical protein
VSGNSCYLVPPISKYKGGGVHKILSMSEGGRRACPGRLLYKLRLRVGVTLRWV